MDKTALVLVLNDDVTEEQLKELGFVKGSYYKDVNYHDGFVYEFLAIDSIDKTVKTESCLDGANGDKALLKFYELVKLGYVHTKEVTLEDN